MKACYLNHDLEKDTGAGRFCSFLLAALKSIIKTGGVKLAKNRDELIEYVKIYLNNPDKDKKKRKRIIEERIWKLDSKSGKRLAEAINKYI